MTCSGTAKEMKVMWQVTASRSRDNGTIMFHLNAGGSSAWFYLTAEEAVALADGLRAEAEWLRSQSPSSQDAA